MNELCIRVCLCHVTSEGYSCGCDNGIYLQSFSSLYLFLFLAAIFQFHLYSPSPTTHSYFFLSFKKKTKKKTKQTTTYTGGMRRSLISVHLSTDVKKASKPVAVATAKPSATPAPGTVFILLV